MQTDPVQVLNQGDILLYPTDTLYGLGVDALNRNALKKLRTLKGREEGKPISIVVADLTMAEEYAVVTPLAKRLVESFLPGKLTLVMEAKSLLPEELTAGTGTVGIRIPKHMLCLALAKDFGRPFTATSANVSGEEPQHSVSEILKQFGQRAELITRSIDLGMLAESLPSTTVDVRGDVPHIMRAGAVSEEDIFSVL